MIKPGEQPNHLYETIYVSGGTNPSCTNEIPLSACHLSTKALTLALPTDEDVGVARKKEQDHVNATFLADH